MNIQFNNVLPAPLKTTNPLAMSIWNKKMELDSGNKVLVEAKSGKGKSTLIHLLYGIRKDYDGSVCFGDNNLKDFDLKSWSEFRKSIVSIVFQDLQLFTQLTVFENLQLKNQLTNHFDKETVFELICRVGLEEKTHVVCGKLSMGQQQRVAILRAICQPFNWLLLDEPFSHLDQENSLLCMELINEFCDKQGAGWILTSLGGEVYSRYDHLFQI